MVTMVRGKGQEEGFYVTIHIQRYIHIHTYIHKLTGWLGGWVAGVAGWLARSRTHARCRCL